MDMETLGGFPCLPAMVRAEQSSPAPHATIEMETLGGFPCLPATVRAEQSSAAPHATIEMETLGGFPCLPATVRAEQSSAAPHATMPAPGARPLRERLWTELRVYLSSTRLERRILTHAIQAEFAATLPNPPSTAARTIRKYPHRKGYARDQKIGHAGRETFNSLTASRKRSSSSLICVSAWMRRLMT
jgi:hypothetical protein